MQLPILIRYAQRRKESESRIRVTIPSHDDHIRRGGAPAAADGQAAGFCGARFSFMPHLGFPDLDAVRAVIARVRRFGGRARRCRSRSGRRARSERGSASLRAMDWARPACRLDWTRRQNNMYNIIYIVYIIQANIYCTYYTGFGHGLLAGLTGRVPDAHPAPPVLSSPRRSRTEVLRTGRRRRRWRGARRRRTMRRCTPRPRRARRDGTALDPPPRPIPGQWVHQKDCVVQYLSAGMVGESEGSNHLL